MNCNFLNILHLYKSYKENACNEPANVKSALNELEYKFGTSFNYYVKYSNHFIDIYINMPKIYLLKNIVFYISHFKLNDIFTHGNMRYIHIKKKCYISNAYGTVIKINKKLINKPLPCLYNKFMYLYNNKNIFFTTKNDIIDILRPLKKSAIIFYNRDINDALSIFYSIYDFNYIYDNYFLYKMKNISKCYIYSDFDYPYTYINNSHIILLFI